MSGDLAAVLAEWLDRDDVGENRAADEVRERADEINAVLQPLIDAAVEADRQDAVARIQRYAEEYYDSGQREGFEVAAKIAGGWLRHG